jgi:hypothetical protein
MATIAVGPDPVLAATCVMTPPVVVDGPAPPQAFSHRFARSSTIDVPKRFGRQLGGCYCNRTTTGPVRGGTQRHRRHNGDPDFALGKPRTGTAQRPVPQTGSSMPPGRSPRWQWPPRMLSKPTATCRSSASPATCGPSNAGRCRKTTSALHAQCDAAEHAQGRFLDGFRRAKRRRTPLRRGPEGVAAATPRVLDPNRGSDRTTG